jgi:tRNA pseudouridine55 synthase
MSPVFPGLHLAHKPRGATSSSLVAGLRERAAAGGEPGLALCHGGALDPFAEGLLLLLAGPATRLMEDLHPIPKTYEALLAWGQETDSGDLHGAVVAEGPPPQPGSERALESVLLRFSGWTLQVPPATSNKRVGGERAWAKAHRGEWVELPPSPVFLHEARFLSHDLPRTSRLLLTVRGGYYVRSLARDLARALGSRAHLAALRRTAIGPFLDPGPSREEHVPGARMLPWLAARALTSEEAKRVELGRPIERGQLAPPTFPLPAGFAGPGKGPPQELISVLPKQAKVEPAPIAGLCEGALRVLLRERGASLVLRTDLGGGF